MIPTGIMNRRRGSFRMKKAAAVVLTLTVFLLQFPVLAETGRPLYAVRGENGLWGYIDPRGELVIPCRFTWAEDFRGGYAIACQYPEGFVLPEDPDGVLPLEDGTYMKDYGLDGIIDTRGEWTVAPEWFGIMSCDDDGSWFGGPEDGVYLFEQLLPGGQHQVVGKEGTVGDQYAKGCHVVFLLGLQVLLVWIVPF